MVPCRARVSGVSYLKGGHHLHHFVDVSEDDLVPAIELLKNRRQQLLEKLSGAILRDFAQRPQGELAL